VITRNSAWFDQNAFYQIRLVETIKRFFSVRAQDRGEQSRREKEMQIFASLRRIYHEHCRLAGCRRPRRIRSVSFESARCVWLTSRPSWPLEGGRPPGGPPITRPVSATRTRPRSVIPSSTFERRSCTTPSRAVPSKERQARVTSHRRKSRERPGRGYPPREIG